MELNISRNSNADIFIYSHIPFQPVTDDHVYKVLTDSNAPAENFKTDLEIFRDYTFNNIANMNLMYNEYCGFYWIWKNYPVRDYVGMLHYRRMFLTDKGTIIEHDSMPTLDNVFEDHSIILNKAFPLRMMVGLEGAGKLFNNYDWYAYWHNIDDLNTMKEVVLDLYPEYADGWEKMCNATYIYPSSLFIMKWDMFDEYCNFIFKILAEYRKCMGFFTTEDCVKYVEEHADKYINKGPGHEYYDIQKQSRIVGYLAERVLAAFLMHDRGDGLGTIEDKALFMNWAVLPEKYYRV